MIHEQLSEDLMTDNRKAAAAAPRKTHHAASIGPRQVVPRDSGANDGKPTHDIH